MWHNVEAKRPRSSSVLCVLLFAAASCESTPEDSLTSAFAALSEGDARGIESAFTRESAPLARAWWALGQEGQSAFTAPVSAALPQVGPVEYREESDRHREPVTVAYVQASVGAKSLTVPMVQQRGAWRVDLLRMATKRVPRTTWLGGGMP